MLMTHHMLTTQNHTEGFSSVSCFSLPLCAQAHVISCNRAAVSSIAAQNQRICMRDRFRAVKASGYLETPGG